MVKLVHAYGLQDSLLASFYTETDVGLTTHSGRKAVLEFANGYEIDLVGSALTFEGLAITGGRLDRIVFRDPQGNAIASATELKGYDAFSVYDTLVTQPADVHPFLFNGDDTIVGSGGNDMMHGYAGRDRINGNAGDDVLRGGTGIDRLSGGSGEDEFDGASGNDTLTGGGGADTFFGGAGSDHDIVRDFDASGPNHDWIWNEGGQDVSWARAGDDLLLTFDSGDTMRLIGVKPWQFSDDLILSEIA